MLMTNDTVDLNCVLDLTDLLDKYKVEVVQQSLNYLVSNSTYLNKHRAKHSPPLDALLGPFGSVKHE